MAVEETFKGTQGPDTLAPIALESDRETLYEAPRSNGGAVVGTIVAIATLGVVGLVAFTNQAETFEMKVSAPVAAAAPTTASVELGEPEFEAAPAPSEKPAAASKKSAPVAYQPKAAPKTALASKKSAAVTKVAKVQKKAPMATPFDPTDDIAPGLDLDVGPDRVALGGKSRKLPARPSASQGGKAFIKVHPQVRSCMSGLDPMVSRTIDVVLSIEGSTGSVVSAQVGGVKSPAVASCIERAVHRAHFPVFSQHRATLRHKYRF